GVLAVKSGQAAVVAAVGVANPNIVIGGAAITLAIPHARAADVGDAIALRRIDTFLAVAASQPMLPASLKERCTARSHLENPDYGWRQTGWFCCPATSR